MHRLMTRPLRRVIIAVLNNGVVFMSCSGRGDAAGHSSAAGPRGHPGAQQEGSGERASDLRSICFFSVDPPLCCPLTHSLACTVVAACVQHRAWACAALASISALPNSSAMPATRDRQERMLRSPLKPEIVAPCSRAGPAGAMAAWPTSRRTRMTVRLLPTLRCYCCAARLVAMADLAGQPDLMLRVAHKGLDVSMRA